jgi:hypothetical protein
MLMETIDIYIFLFTMQLYMFGLMTRIYYAYNGINVRSMNYVICL